MLRKSLTVVGAALVAGTLGYVALEVRYIRWMVADIQDIVLDRSRPL